VKWRGQEIFVSEALRGEPIGIVEVADGQWAVHFGPLLLGHFDDKGRFNRPRPGKRPSQVATEMKVSPMSPG
jgi:hypothetical protein